MWSIVTESQLALDGNYDRGSCLKHVGTEGSDRHTDPQFAATSFCDRSVDQPTSHHGQLELAHRTLEAEQQPIVGQARIVDAVGVKHSRADEPAQLEEVVPITSVASEPGSFEAEDRADYALADLPDERLEPRPRVRSARRDSEIVVDYNDVTEPVRPRVVGKLVLATLALEVLLDLNAR
jgi:hypothetical protein